MTRTMRLLLKQSGFFEEEAEYKNNLEGALAHFHKLNDKGGFSRG